MIFAVMFGPSDYGTGFSLIYVMFCTYFEGYPMATMQGNNCEVVLCFIFSKYKVFFPFFFLWRKIPRFTMIMANITYLWLLVEKLDFMVQSYEILGLIVSHANQPKTRSLSIIRTLHQCTILI